MLSDFIGNRLEQEYLTCKFTFSGKSWTPVDFFRCMIFQALEGKTALPSQLRKYDIDFWSTRSHGIANSWQTLWAFWTHICEKAPRGQVFWIIDVLDECTDTAKRKDFLVCVISLIERLIGVGSTSLCFRVVLISRSEIWRELKFGQASNVVTQIIFEEKSVIDEDIERYINIKVHELAENARFMKSANEEDVEDLRNRLRRRADRTFIWLSLRFKAFEDDLYYDKATWAEAKNEIASTLDETYDKPLLQLRDCEGRTRDLLQFLLAAYRSFTVLELNMLLALGSRPQTVAVVLEKAREIGHTIDRDVYGSFYDQ